MKSTSNDRGAVWALRNQLQFGRQDAERLLSVQWVAYWALRNPANVTIAADLMNTIRECERKISACCVEQEANYRELASLGEHDAESREDMLQIVEAARVSWERRMDASNTLEKLHCTLSS